MTKAGCYNDYNETIVYRCRNRQCSSTNVVYFLYLKCRESVKNVNKQHFFIKKLKKFIKKFKKSLKRG